MPALVHMQSETAVVLGIDYKQKLNKFFLLNYVLICDDETSDNGLTASAAVWIAKWDHAIITGKFLFITMHFCVKFTQKLVCGVMSSKGS
jgi:hypothetical protein